MRVLFITLTIVAIDTIDAATISLNHCEVAKLIIAYNGICPMNSSDPCEDYCTGEIIETEIDCSIRDECCWTGEECIMKEIPEPRYEDTTPEEDSNSEMQDQATVAPMEENMPEETTLKRSKRRAGGGFEADVDVGRNGIVQADGTYQHDPSGAYDANVGYRPNIPGGHVYAQEREFPVIDGVKETSVSASVSPDVGDGNTL